MNIFDLSFTGIWIKAGWMSMMSIITGLLAWRIAGLAKIDNVPANDSAQAAESARAELAALKKEADKAHAELRNLKTVSGSDDKKSAAKDSEIKRLSAQLVDTQARQEASENRFAQLKETEKAYAGAESDAQRDKAEIEKQKQIADGLLDELDRLKADSSAGKEELAAKDSEIKRLSAQLVDTQARQEASENRLK
ncbi:MAG: hypothetical protein NTY34_02315, partial [Candidatus Omnitrophica bacterium]|nr:hypothetical protein [Candidatus Omnitrophota bacterium]